MGNGIVKKVAIVINGDSENRHLNNTKRAVEQLHDAGYEIHLINPDNINIDSIKSYYKPNLNNLNKLIKGINTDNDDEVLLYTTGHGAGAEDLNKIVIGKELITHEDLFNTVEPLSSGYKTIIMDQCGSGMGANYWFDKKSLFISPDQSAQETKCQYFSPQFWEHADKIKEDGGDANLDGVITFQERFSYAFAVYSKNVRDSLPLFLPGIEYKDSGLNVKFPKKSFLNDVTNIKNYKNNCEFEKVISQLNPGQYAIVNFSATWCDPCHQYAPHFERMAKKSFGETLYVKVLINEQSIPEWMNKLEVTRLPTVMLFDHQGQYVKVQDINNPMKDLSKLAVSGKVSLKWLRETLFKDPFNPQAIERFKNIAKSKVDLLDEKDIQVLKIFLLRRHSDSVSILENIIKLRPDLIENERDYFDKEIRFTKNLLVDIKIASDNYRDGKYKIALKIVNKCIKMDTKYVGAYVLRALIQSINENDHKQQLLALKDLNTALKFNPYHEYAMIYKTKVLYILGKRDAARSNTVLAIKMNSATAIILAKNAINDGEFKIAGFIVGEGLKYLPDNADLLNIFCFIKYKTNAPDFIDVLNRALKVMPNDFNLLNQKGIYELGQGNRVEARNLFLKSIENNRLSMNPSKFNLVVSYLMPKKIDLNLGYSQSLNEERINGSYTLGVDVSWELYQWHKYLSLDLYTDVDYLTSKKISSITTNAGMAISIFDRWIQLSLAAGNQMKLSENNQRNGKKNTPLLQYGVNLSYWLTNNYGVGFTYKLQQTLEADSKLNMITSLGLEGRIW
ncbi:hypothetical protein BVY03_00850 [bacterium K02(2017)]|nr:hypothetical protein BVY03_00850 [bacterium K02(2017)]